MAGATALMTALGLASAAGLNAYIPLLIVGLLGRYTNIITLSGPTEYLTNPWVLLVIAILLLADMIGDKIPAVDSAFHAVGLVVQPIAGAILALAATSAFNVDPTIAAVLGLVAALGVHGVRATARPVVTATTAGTANPVLSFAEDAGSLTMSVAAIFAPIIALILSIGVIAGGITVVRRWRKRQ